MKRTRYDSEYDKIRDRTGLSRPQVEFPEQEDAPADVVTEDFRRRMDERAAIEATQAAERKADLEKWRASANRDMVAREYLDYGLTPPDPLVSLSLLQSIGWKLEQYGDRWELIPARASVPTSKEGIRA